MVAQPHAAPFFHDPARVAALRETVLPGLLDDAGRRGALRLWVTGCATGEPACALAMLVADALGAGAPALPVHIFATDGDEAALAAARRGRYAAAAFAALPGALAARYLAATGETCRLRDDVGDLLVFGRHDLGRRAPLARIDLALCCDPLGAAGSDARDAAWAALAHAVREDGYLLVADGDAGSPPAAQFAPRDDAPWLYRRRGGRAPEFPGLADAAAYPDLLATVEELTIVNEALLARGAERRDGAGGPAADGLDDAILVVEPGGAALTNAAYRRRFGDPATPPAARDAAGRPLPPEASPWERAARGEAFAMECTLEARGGTPRRFEVSGQPVADPGVQRRRSVLVLRELAGRGPRQLQDEFIATVSHDLRTPLTALRAGLGLLEARAADRLEPAERDLVANLRRNALRLARLIDDLLTFNQIRIGTLAVERAPLDLGDLAADAAASLAPVIAAKGQRLAVDLARPLPVEADRRRLAQALTNLLDNASRHTPAGTRIALTGRAAAGEVALLVADDGPGIPEAARRRLRERAAAGEGGRGLGLAIARGIVELQGGRLWIDDATGPEGPRGTTIGVALPRAAPAR
ncbi:MAG TPA: CheR family methyltransferase [Thermomicrobiales bacterium]|nr:CheR family methyltransferase [Thermomicrobiales bacterium]